MWDSWGVSWGDSWGSAWGPLHEVDEGVGGGSTVYVVNRERSRIEQDDNEILELLSIWMIQHGSNPTLYAKRDGTPPGGHVTH